MENSIDPGSLHKYLYAGGDPTNWVDPMGREDEEETSLAYTIGRAVGAAVRVVGLTVRNCIDGIFTTVLGAVDIYQHGASPLGYALEYYGSVRVSMCLVKFFPVPKMPSPVPKMPWPGPPSPPMPQPPNFPPMEWGPF